MQDSTNGTNPPRYFIAANGYSGFRSYFDKVFERKQFERVFILKGGPGTGKSSFLRALESLSRDLGMKAEIFLCSSDPDSYDGIILEKDGVLFAALDGTSPHTFDCEIPGAIDEIVNLGDAWDEAKLRSSRERIETLVKKKKTAYQKGYEFLRSAGFVKAVENDLYKYSVMRKDLISEAKTVAESYFSDAERGCETPRLLSSFGRSGYLELDAPNDRATRMVLVRECGFVTDLFMSALTDSARNMGIGFTRFPTVFDDAVTDALYVPSLNVLIKRTKGVTADIHPDTHLISDFDDAAVVAAKELHSLLLENAKCSFSVASDLHFEAEKIYIGSMHFDKNSELLEKCAEKIKNAVK